jgi:acyl carrier protein
VGEIYIRTPYRTLGYYRRPDLTAASFVANPATGDPADMVYRTGDLARLRADGCYELIGRADGQMKIRGVRVEPQEIEAALLACDGVVQATAVDREGAAGTRILCAYVVLRPEMSMSTVRERLQTLLPDYMMPNAYVPLDELPRTANGKVDRTALPSPDLSTREPADIVTPRGPVEEALAALWTEVLGVANIGATDDFFALGGHSLTVMVLVSRINAAFGVDFPIVAAFDARTLESMAAEIERMIREEVLAMPEADAEGLWSSADSRRRTDTATAD